LVFSGFLKEYSIVGNYLKEKIAIKIKREKTVKLVVTKKAIVIAIKNNKP